MQQPGLIKFRSITQAAVALALGGRYVKQVTEYRVVFFYVEPPPGIDLDDPDLTVPVQPLIGWTEMLASRVRQHVKLIRGSAEENARRVEWRSDAIRSL